MGVGTATLVNVTVRQLDESAELALIYTLVPDTDVTVVPATKTPDVAEDTESPTEIDSPIEREETVSVIPVLSALETHPVVLRTLAF